MCIDIMEILMFITRRLKLVMAKSLASRALLEMTAEYVRHAMTVTTILSDEAAEFTSARVTLADAGLRWNIAAPNTHVPEAERAIHPPNQGTIPSNHNDTTIRTTGAICVGHAGRLQRAYNFLSVATKVITRSDWDEIPIPRDAIDCGNARAVCEKNPAPELNPDHVNAPEPLPQANDAHDGRGHFDPTLPILEPFVPAADEV